MKSEFTALIVPEHKMCKVSLYCIVLMLIFSYFIIQSCAFTIDLTGFYRLYIYTNIYVFLMCIFYCNYIHCIWIIFSLLSNYFNISFSYIYAFIFRGGGIIGFFFRLNLKLLTDPATRTFRKLLNWSINIIGLTRDRLGLTHDRIGLMHDTIGWTYDTIGLIHNKIG